MVHAAQPVDVEHREVASTVIETTTESPEVDRTAQPLLASRPWLIVVGVLGIGAGMAAVWLASLAWLLTFESEAAQLPTYANLGIGAISTVVGIGAFLGVLRSSSRSSTSGSSARKKPPGLVFNLAVWLACIWAAHLMTDIGDFWSGLVLLADLVALLLMGVVWSIRVVSVPRHRDRGPSARSIAQWLLAPAAVVTLVTFGLVVGYRHLRFEMSETAMTTDAQELLAAAAGDAAEQGDGWLRVDDTRRVGQMDFDWVSVHVACSPEGGCDPDTASVHYTYSGIVFSTYTYIYSPSGQPSTSDGGMLEHLGGPWWYSEWHD